MPQQLCCTSASDTILGYRRVAVNQNKGEVVSEEPTMSYSAIDTRCLFRRTKGKNPFPGRLDYAPSARSISNAWVRRRFGSSVYVVVVGFSAGEMPG